MMAHDLPPWTVVYQQVQRWMKAGVFVVMTHDLRLIPRLAEQIQAVTEESVEVQIAENLRFVTGWKY